MLSDVFINLEILNTPLILVIMLLQDNNIFKKLTSGIMDSLTGFQDNLVQSWWPDFPTGVAGHVGGTSVKVNRTRGSGTTAFQQCCCYFIRLVNWVTSAPSHWPVHSWFMVMGCVCTWPTKTPQSPSHKAVLPTSGITRSGRSAKSGRPSTFGVELRSEYGTRLPSTTLLNPPWLQCLMYHILRNTSRIMMTSSNGNIFRVTGHLCGEFTGHRWIPVTKARALVFSLIRAWISGWVNNREAGDFIRHRAHYDVIVMCSAKSIEPIISERSRWSASRDVMIWKCFPYYWPIHNGPIVRGIRGNPLVADGFQEWSQ